MKYGFVIDNRKCIGCHACTTACKSEHDVAVGVNRTWVKYIEKGVFPDSRRIFSVMRCNHCTDAPCVDICPVESLFFRDDGIVDFDNRRCIACKSCMQACPYDALYIDPDTQTAAKCNYCAHRVDVGLEPACVNVCPTHAIVSGDMDDPSSEISMLKSRQAVKVRKPEKGTDPNLFYIAGDEASITPGAALDDASLWSAQTLGVGHYAKEAEKLAFSNPDVLSAIQQANEREAGSGAAYVDILKGKARKSYAAPDKGILWGWEVAAYLTTKAISAGAFLVLFMAFAFDLAPVSDVSYWWSLAVGLVFLGLTGVFLVMDLDRPDRFLNVLLRPQWKSWLVKGAYAITAYGALLSLLAVAKWMSWTALVTPLLWITATVAIVVAIYTAFLFAQAKARDFWQSPTLVIHMLVHSLMAGAATFGILALVADSGAQWLSYLSNVLIATILVNLFTMLAEITITHPTKDAKDTVQMITTGRYKTMFWFGVVLLGNLLPLAILFFTANAAVSLALAALVCMIGIYITEKIWTEAPQRIALV